MLVTYWSVNFTLLFQYPYFFRQIFSRQTFGRKFSDRRWLGGYARVTELTYTQFDVVSVETFL